MFKKNKPPRKRVLGLYRFGTYPPVLALYESLTDFELRLIEQRDLPIHAKAPRALDYAKYAFLGNDKQPLGQWTIITDRFK
jgi:hypothetical protein